jgi:hypothetical protein
MKKYILLLIISFGIWTNCNSLFAHHHHVSNVPGVTADFTTIQQAHDATNVNAGDTIYLEPSSTSYGNLNWSKELIIIGNGYFLAANPETQANTATSKINAISIIQSADGSIIMGCEINSVTFAYNVHQVRISRNFIGSIDFVGTNPGAANYILQNYISGISAGDYMDTYIENNYIVNLNGSPIGNSIIRNNLITGSLNIYNSDVRNNIISGTNVHVYSSPDPHNNVCAGSPFGTTNGNQANVNMNDVFVCWSTCNTYSPDGRFQLKPGSVAAGAGYGGGDCGMFDGNYPYVLSGIPPVPAIYYLNAQPVGDLMNLRMKVKTHN